MCIRDRLSSLETFLDRYNYRTPLYASVPFHLRLTLFSVFCHFIDFSLFNFFFFLFAFFRNVESSVRYNNKDQNAICTMIQETTSSTRSLYVCVQHANVKRSVYEVLRTENSHLFNLDKNILQDKNNVTQVRLWASLSKHPDEKFPASINWKIAYSLSLIHI